MSKREWFRAKIRWGVMVEGKEGLRCWEESIHVFVSQDRDTAFQQALEIGRQRQTCHTEGRRWVEKRLAQVLTLDDLGTDLTEFEATWYTTKPTEILAFEHVFDPQGRRPNTMF